MEQLDTGVAFPWSSRVEAEIQPQHAHGRYVVVAADWATGDTKPIDCWRRSVGNWYENYWNQRELAAKLQTVSPAAMTRSTKMRLIISLGTAAARSLWYKASSCSDCGCPRCKLMQSSMIAAPCCSTSPTLLSKSLQMRRCSSCASLGGKFISRELCSKTLWTICVNSFRADCILGQVKTLEPNMMLQSTERARSLVMNSQMNSLIPYLRWTNDTIVFRDPAARSAFRFCLPPLCALANCPPGGAYSSQYARPSNSNYHLAAAD